MPPRISVVITTYNKATYLRQSVESVMQQTYDNVECIVVDDGSTDDTPQVMAAIQADYPQVVYYRKPNGGVSSARNFGWERAAGDWMQFLDADDWIHPDKLRAQLAAIPNPDATVVVYTDYERVYMDHQNQIIETKPHLVGACDPVDLIDRLLICPDFLADTPFPLLQQSLLFRRSLLNSRCFDVRLQACEDRELVVHWLKQGIPVVYVPMIGAYYRKHRHNLTDNGALMRAAYIAYFQRVQTAYPDLRGACQPSVHYLLSCALEECDRDSWCALSQLAIYPLELLGGRLTISQEWQMKWIYRLREVIPTGWVYPHRRGARTRKVIKFLRGLGVWPAEKVLS